MGGEGGHEVDEFLADVDDFHGDAVFALPEVLFLGLAEKGADEVQAQDPVPVALQEHGGQDAVQASGKEGQCVE